MDIEITVNNFRCFSYENPIHFPLKKGIQAFVGVNNSGKSSLLRMFYELRPIFQSLIPTNQNFSGEAMSYGNYGLVPQVKDIEELFCNRNERDAVIGFDLYLDQNHSSKQRFEIVLVRGGNSWQGRFYVGNERAKSIVQTHEGRLPTRLGAGDPAFDSQLLRDLQARLTNMLYLGPFRNSINIGGMQNYYDIQTGQQFITTWKQWKTGYGKKQSQAMYRLMADIKRIFGFTSLDINASPDDQNLQLMIDDKTYQQSEIGSGLIQFVLVLANAAIHNPAYILIDEPESNLHPSLQLDFLTTLASYASEGVLFATHNVGLARAAADRVFSVRRVSEFGRDVRDFSGTPALSEFLGELGFNAYQDLGFETVLLVEGPKDVKTVQQLLRLYGTEHRVVLLPLGGSSLINARAEMQLSEIMRISGHVSALIDSERTHENEAISPDRAAFAKICSELQIKLHILERRAVENYMPEHAIRAVKGSGYRALAPYELLKSANPAWSKEENWKIAREMTIDDIKGTDLGNFLLTL